jgi:hypothetical protein
MITRVVAVAAATPKMIATTGFGDPVFIENEGADVLYIGGTNAVTNLTGFAIQVAPNVLSRIDLKDYAGEIWGYSTAGCSVRLIENISG